MLIITAKRKKEAPYQTNLSEVKKTQREKRGIDKARDIIPTMVNSFESLL